MKPPVFEYERPGSVAEATALLAQHGEEGKVLAGGQSFVPMLNLRLARPGVVVDIARLDLRTVEVRGDILELGALVRHRDAEIDPVIASAVPLLAQAAPHIGHRSIRNRGTLGGSIAHADSTAEVSLCALATDATIVVANDEGVRELPVDNFFLGPFTTVLEPEDLVVQLKFPRIAAGERHGFAEIARRSGDFALAAAGVVVPSRNAGADLRVAVVGAGPAPRLVRLSGSDRPEKAGDLEALAADVVEKLESETGAQQTFQRGLIRAVVIDAFARAMKFEKEVAA